MSLWSHGLACPTWPKREFLPTELIPWVSIATWPLTWPPALYVMMLLYWVNIFFSLILKINQSSASPFLLCSSLTPAHVAPWPCSPSSPSTHKQDLMWHHNRWDKFRYRGTFMVESLVLFSAARVQWGAWGRFRLLSQVCFSECSDLGCGETVLMDVRAEVGNPEGACREKCTAI